MWRSGHKFSKFIRRALRAVVLIRMKIKYGSLHFLSISLCHFPLIFLMICTLISFLLGIFELYFLLWNDDFFVNNFTPQNLICAIFVKYYLHWFSCFVHFQLYIYTFVNLHTMHSSSKHFLSIRNLVGK